VQAMITANDIKVRFMFSSKYVESLIKEKVIGPDNYDNDDLYLLSVIKSITSDDGFSLKELGNLKKCKKDVLKDLLKQKYNNESIEMVLEKILSCYLRKENEMEIFLHKISFNPESKKITLENIVRENENIKLEIKIENKYELEGVVDNYVLECKDVKKMEIVDMKFSVGKILDEHSMLLETNEDVYNLAIRGKADKYYEVLAKLNDAYKSIYKSNGNIGYNIGYKDEAINILKDGFGNFAEGPKTLLVEFEKVLNEYSIKTVISASREIESKDNKIFLFDESYIIANEFKILKKD